MSVYNRRFLMSTGASKDFSPKGTALSARSLVCRSSGTCGKTPIEGHGEGKESIFSRFPGPGELGIISSDCTCVASKQKNNMRMTITVTLISFLVGGFQGVALPENRQCRWPLPAKLFPQSGAVVRSKNALAPEPFHQGPGERH